MGIRLDLLSCEPREKSEPPRPRANVAKDNTAPVVAHAVPRTLLSPGSKSARAAIYRWLPVTAVAALASASWLFYELFR